MYISSSIFLVHLSYIFCYLITNLRKSPAKVLKSSEKFPKSPKEPEESPKISKGSQFLFFAILYGLSIHAILENVTVATG